MVNSESEVIPSPAGLHAGNVDEALPTDDLDSVLRSRSSRPHLDNGWLDEDHYFDGNVPTDEYVHGEWKEIYRDIDLTIPALIGHGD